MKQSESLPSTASMAPLPGAPTYDPDPPYARLAQAEYWWDADDRRHSIRWMEADYLCIVLAFLEEHAASFHAWTAAHHLASDERLEPDYEAWVRKQPLYRALQAALEGPAVEQARPAAGGSFSSTPRSGH